MLAPVVAGCSANGLEMGYITTLRAVTVRSKKMLT